MSKIGKLEKTQKTSPRFSSSSSLITPLRWGAGWGVLMEFAYYELEKFAKTKELERAKKFSPQNYHVRDSRHFRDNVEITYTQLIFVKKLMGTDQR